MLITHGHSDHVGDALEIAQRTGAKVVANYEICMWLGRYWIIVAESLAAAAAIASENPVLPHGLNFEIRPLESERGSAYRHTNETPEA